MPVESKPPSTAITWPGDVARALAAQEEDHFRQFLFQAVAVERHVVVIVLADLRRVHRLRHRGIDRTGRDRVDADVQRSKLGRLLLGQVREAGLAGAVGGAQRRGAQARDRGDVDDGAAAAVAHQRRRGLRAQKRSGEIDRQHARPVFVGHLEDRLEDGDAGIVDQRVEPAESFGDGARRRALRRFGSATSQVIAIVTSGLPSALNVRCRLSPSISSSATRQPSARKRLAVASPMPRAAPVTRATFDRRLAHAAAPRDDHATLREHDGGAIGKLRLR